MSRARNIKPGFFKNDLLAECNPLARILFIGLWCEADRDGRLENRPKRIKAQCLPYDNCDVQALLGELADRGFITCYQVAGADYIAIPEFAKHQNPHCKEQASSIPAPDMHGASTVQEQGLHGESTELARLIPDSPSLIPDSSSEPDGSGADAPAANDQPPADPLWGTGLAFLMRKGIPEKPARSLLGRLKHSLGDGEAARIVGEAEAQDITDPAPWLLKAIGNAKARAGPGKDRPSIAQQFGQKTYTGTPDDELPSFLRDNAA